MQDGHCHCTTWWRDKPLIDGWFHIFKVTSYWTAVLWNSPPGFLAKRPTADQFHSMLSLCAAGQHHPRLSMTARQDPHASLQRLEVDKQTEVDQLCLRQHFLDISSPHIPINHLISALLGLICVTLCDSIYSSTSDHGQAGHTKATICLFTTINFI